jgi:hypothetical protein
MGKIPISGDGRPFEGEGFDWNLRAPNGLFLTEAP